ncbi:MAG: hypothetical protein JNK82_38825 [Myxococcaceae bacterium]|nr:hypothetical protein [Myxococcaceae bacterium]
MGELWPWGWLAALVTLAVALLGAGRFAARRRVRPDPPHLRSIARFSLSPWGAWATLDHAARQHVVARLNALIAELDAAGSEFRKVHEEAERLSAVSPKFDLWFLPANEAGTWEVRVRELNDTPATREFLPQLDAALRKLLGGPVRWYKNESPGGAPAESPVQS